MVQRIVPDRRLENSLAGELDEARINQVRLWMKGVLTQRIFRKDQYHHDLVLIVARLGNEGMIDLVLQVLLQQGLLKDVPEMHGAG